MLLCACARSLALAALLCVLHMRSRRTFVSRDLPAPFPCRSVNCSAHAPSRKRSHRLPPEHAHQWTCLLGAGCERVPGSTCQGRRACAVEMSAEATTAPLPAPEACAPVVPTQHQPTGGAVGVTFDLKPLNPSSKYVKLNVGGSLHYTTVQTLTKQDTMLKAMFSGRMEVLTDSEGWILIDRSGRHFGTILNYLRDGSVSLPESQRELEEVLSEARYYLIQGLVEDCQLALQQKTDAYDPLCLIPMVTSPKEEQQIICSCSKPVVKLLHNRSNNKYSYTSNSDDNLLKNIELFDKLALRFNGRVLFIKDVLGDEICCWSFYGQGRKIAEVCCTSIVYATEKKQTKVEFPEARIFEETLNILIYETPRVPDKALLEATGGAAGGGGGPHRADEEDGREHRVRRIHVRRHIMHDERPHGHQAVFKD